MAFTRTDTSTRVRPVSVTVGSTRKGRATPSPHLYRISSNSPSGGTKAATRSALKRPRLTQGWKVTS